MREMRPSWLISETRREYRAWRVACCAVLLCLAPVLPAPTSPALAESLSEALTAAYRSNPQLDAERASLRATDEEVPRALSGYRPNVIGSGTFTQTNTETTPRATLDGSNSPTTWEINVSQQVFDGFQTTNAVSEAEAVVRAGRENLRNIESNILLEAVTAYSDVIRDQATLRLREKNVMVLTRELDAANARRAVSEVTITDVAQARARRARAVSAADLAKSNLRISRANYKRVIGHEAQNLRAPALRIKGLPRSRNEALSIAERENAIIISALYQEQAARFGVDKIWGEMLPRVDLEANYSHTTSPSILTDRSETATISGRLTIPFYQRGEVHARVRQAKHTHVSRLQRIEQARTEVQANVTAAWSRLVAARAQLASDKVQVDAARIALDGVREEEKVGQRTLLDVLNAEQELLDAQVSQVATRRDLVVASYALLASIGRLTADQRYISEEVYDPEVHYEEVRRKWFGVTITQREEVEPVIEEEIIPVVEKRRWAAAEKVVEEEPVVAETEVYLRGTRTEIVAEPRPVLERLFKQTLR